MSNVRAHSHRRAARQQLPMHTQPSPEKVESLPTRLRESLNGAWPSVITPTAILLFSALGETAGIPNFVVTVVALALFFGSFGLLVKTQFARRQRNADVFVSFVLAELLGLVLLALVLLLAFRR